jgi:hypothetical protein
MPCGDQDRFKRFNYIFIRRTQKKIKKALLEDVEASIGGPGHELTVNPLTAGFQRLPVYIL